MQIYTRQTLDKCVWPTTAEGDYASRVLGALVREGTQPFIANVSAEVRALLTNNLALPLVLVNGEATPPNAYVCSPTTHYVDYAQREVELELANQPVLRKLAPPLLELLRPLLRWSRAERSVYVNNWLLSTNLYPTLGNNTLRVMRDALLTAHPDHSIVFRSLNESLNGAFIADLESLGFVRVFSRQVYLLDPRDGSFRRRNNYGNDRRLARRSGYHWREAADLAPETSARLCDLYNDLYVRKYSHYNPQFTPAYIERALGEQWLSAAALVQGERIDGVLGFIEQYGLITAPLVGYDRARDQHEGLYRLLMLRLVEQAAERGRVLHLSSGAASFKRLRGGEPQLEYSLVYHRHLVPHRRLTWQLLGWLSRRAIIPLMQRYGL